MQIYNTTTWEYVLNQQPLTSAQTEEVRATKVAKGLPQIDRTIRRNPRDKSIPLKNGVIWVDGQPTNTTYGWMLDAVVLTETKLVGRYKWLYLGKPGSLPATEWCSHPLPQQMIENALDQMYLGNMSKPLWRSNPDEARTAILYLLDWLLWSLRAGIPYQQPNDPFSSEYRTFDWVYQSFDLELVLLWPSDYWTPIINQYALGSFDLLGKAAVVNQLFYAPHQLPYVSLTLAGDKLSARPIFAKA